jgi:predicted GNAT family acetyltransferase
MNAKIYKNLDDFFSHVGKYLTMDEALYGNTLEMTHAIEHMPQFFPKDSLWFCSIGTNNEINATVITARYPVVIMEYFSGDINNIVTELVKTISQNLKNIDAMRGNKALADAFSKEWCRSHGVGIKFKMEQRLYRLDKVNDVPLSAGKMRLATMADKELVLNWWHHFHLDVGGEEREDWEASVLPLIEMGWTFFWEDSKPVSMATKTAPTDNSMAVGGVYTPPELRGKGYATSCVAELSRNILQSGKKFCVLTTDLANPTSNSIYIKIGYKPIGDNVYYLFSNR